MAEDAGELIELGGSLWLESPYGLWWIGDHGGGALVNLPGWSAAWALWRSRKLACNEVFGHMIPPTSSFRCLIAIRGKILLTLSYHNGRNRFHLELSRFFSAERVNPPGR